MNWAQIHQIFTKMTNQKTIPQLNSIGFEVIKKLLSGHKYRIYVNHAIKGDEPLSVAFSNSSKQPTDKEVELADKLGRSAWGFDNAVEVNDELFFIVTSHNHCFALIAISPESEVPKEYKEIVRTTVTVWSQLLSTLFFYQRDGLTGLLNRNILLDTINGNTFDTSLFDMDNDNVTNRERRDLVNLPETHAVALIDVDNFKSVNDTWGHSIGDEVLIKLANLMEVTFRECDVICRYGGEEFAVYLRYVSKKKAEEVLERFCVRVEESVFPKVDKVTVSIGFTMAFPGLLASELIERADSALYYAKDNGKNQVVAAEDHQSLWASNDSFDVGEVELF
jgi:diguanylate cyclase (GGDEF)-like protein